MTAIRGVVFVVGDVAFKYSFYSSVCFHGNGRLSLHEEPNTGDCAMLPHHLCSYFLYCLLCVGLELEGICRGDV